MSNRHAKSLKRDMPLYGGWLLSRLSERAAAGVVWAIGAEPKYVVRLLNIALK